MLKPSGIITIITDFGNDDYFVGALKGVILTLNPAAQVVDITNNISPGDVMRAAFTLLNCYAEYPSGTAHYCIADPGVGSSRRPLAIQNNEYYFIGPDNGVLYPSVQQTRFTAVDISHLAKSGHVNSKTFHGRDIFAPAAAVLSKGQDIFTLGPAVENIVELNFPVPRKCDSGLFGLILYVDRFGNLISNFKRDHLSRFKSLFFTINDLKIDSGYEYYEQAPAAEPFYIDGSAGFIEISVRNARADVTLGAKAGDEIMLSGINYD